MDREAILYRYRLALALVPDADQAGDLFMRSCTDADLIRWANRWREGQGLEPLHQPDLPLLDSFQEAHALHLFRRGESRRRSLGLALLFGPLLVLVTVAWVWAAAGRAPAWVAQALRQGALKSEESLVMLRQEVPAGPFLVRLEAVALSRGETRVIYQVPVGLEVVPAELEVGELRLKPLGPASSLGTSGLETVAFDPLPLGAAEVTIHWEPARERVGPLVYRLPAPGVLSPLTRLGDRVHALYRPEPGLALRNSPGRTPFFTDVDGRRYKTEEIPPQGWDGVVQYSLVVLGPPPGAEFVSLTIPEAERSHLVEPLRVSLTRR